MDAAQLEPSEAHPLTAQSRDHWAFQPVTRPVPPAVQHRDWVRSPIDAFILAWMEQAGLAPAPPASREAFIRRVTFDLTGLPPTLEEIDVYLADTSPRADEALVERLLGSPHYGERWGRHWLDLARFGETDGFEHDAVRGNAWRYRDYVIRAFNEDKPYDRFIREQVAGDELFPDDPDAVTATAFNLLGPDMVDSADQVQRRMNRLNDMTDTTGLAFLGLTVGCARCHDHKFEPITQRDYYSLQAFFTPATFKNDQVVATAVEEAVHDKAMRRYEKSLKMTRELLAEVEDPLRERLREERMRQLPEDARAAHATPEDQRSEMQKRLVKQTVKKLEVLDKELGAAMSGEERERWEEARNRMKQLDKPADLPMSMALQPGSPKATHILARGSYEMPREEVAAGFPGVLASYRGPERAASADASQARQRSRLAGWLTQPDHPLAARVIVNRIWQHHFGRGLVRTPSDFGIRGMPPTHPELLDWLAVEFVRRGWSIKEMHRLILLSATYRQGVEAAPETRAKDPENEWFTRWTRQRLEGEAIRDSLLAISGRLNPKMGGPGVFPPIPAELFEGAAGWKVSEDERDHRRRSIYIFARRNLRYPFLEVFDAPDSNLSCAQRGQSTTAPQSLTLLNAEAVLEACRATARRAGEGGVSQADQVRRAYRLILGRAPSGEEMDLALAFLEASPMEELCRALFNLNAFVYVD